MLSELKDFFSANVVKKKKLKREIFELSKRHVPRTYSVDKLAEIHHFLQLEKDFIRENKDSKFISFDYLRDFDTVPQFYYRTSKFPYESTIIPYTPNVLLFCMDNLVDEEKFTYMVMPVMTRG